MKTFLNWLPPIASCAFAVVTASAADLVWIGGTGNWNAAGNWSPAQVPTAADNAWITNTGTYTVTIPAGTAATTASVTVGGASGTQVLAVDRATLTLNGASLIDLNGQLNLLVSQSVVTGAGNLTVNGALNWANGTMSGTGVTTIGSNGVLAILNGGVTFGRTLNHGGTGTWTGGNLTMSAGAGFNNLLGGTFDITADGRLNGSATTPINNSGLFRLTAGSVSTIVNAPFNNSGTLQVLTTTLSLNLGGTHIGMFSNAPGATLNFGGGSHTLSGSSFVTGTGILNVSGAATLSASGTFDTGSTLSVSSGATTLTAGCNLSGATLSLGGGILLFNSAGSVGVLNLTGGTLGGTSPITVSGQTIFSGGTVTNALVRTEGGLTISGNTSLNGTKLVNPAIATWSAGNLTGANAAVISNLFGASFINTFDGNIATGAGATPLFVNEGSFQKTGATAPLGTTSIDFQFINTGTVEVQTNTLRYAINEQNSGLTLLDGGDLAAAAQPVQLLGGSLVGTGLVTVANTQKLINNATVSPGLPLGELDIAGNYQQMASGVLAIELGGYSAGTDFDLVTVTGGGAGGIATLDGKLRVTLTNGFSPTNGATFTFLTALSRVGAFTTFNYPSNDIGMQLTLDATSASVKVTNLKPLVVNPIADPAPITYGAAFNFQFPFDTFADPDNDSLTYAATGMPPGISFSPATRTFSGTPTQAGVFAVAVAAKDTGTPNLTVTNTFNITINPATLTITAQPQTKSYGAADPPLTYTISGLQLSDTPSILTGQLTRDAGESVAGSPYAITQGTLAANINYTVAFAASAFSVTPVPLSVNADSKTKVYGSADPTFTVNYAGFVNNETETILAGTLVLTRAPGEIVGSYLITPGGLTSSNYSISFNSGNLTITKALLTVTADNKAKTYGAADPPFAATYSGLVNGDTPASLLGTLAFDRAPGENVGNYLITPSGLTSPNYTITFNTGTLAINKAPLSVTADDKTKTYGATDPAFTVTYSGFANGDTSAALGGTLLFNREPGENVGSYVITPSGLTSTNYTITFNTGTLTVSKAALAVTADDKTKVYGATDPAFTVTYLGFGNGDTAGALTGTLVINRTSGENVGSYGITPSGLTSTNYTITFNTGTLTISKAALAVTADDETKIFDAADPAFTVTYSGFVNGDSSPALGGTLSFVRAPGESVGKYPITPGGLTSSNYAITFNNGTLTITATAPVILSLVRSGISDVLITWSSLSNATYRVQFKADFILTNWTDLPGDVSATGNSASKTDILTVSNRFYRIAVVP